ncbi:MAG: nucleotidyltransferase domain-containing protein [Candidatus Kapabacteria bacterium]|nr:nucleotidyltransferase domain-containing protein [Ignavibacteriota bacterium]MCW5886093.1 nucleotidyltransferase domain-containing protein [Candidatus Kapabacteria bacterium]
MDKELLDKLRLLKSEASKYFDFQQVFLFGSYAKAENNKSSDIDVAFIVDDISDDFWNLSAKLFEIVDKIDNRIEPLILSKFSDNSGFTENVIKNGILIN